MKYKNNILIKVLPILLFYLMSWANTIKAQTLDTDGDGVFNQFDLDDDNDGILDTDECPQVYLVRPVTTSSVTANKPITSGTASQIADGEGGGGTGNGPFPYWYTNVSNLPIAFSMNMQSASKIDHIKLYLPWGNTEWISKFSVELYNSSNVLLGTENFTTPDQYTGTPLFSFSQEYTSVTRIRFTIISSQNYNPTTPPRASLNEIVFLDLQSSCDLDGDGIPNNLDLDSDGDGCFDAIEGNENVTASHLNSDGSINISSNGGVGTIAGVNNGVPNLVNSGGNADIGGDVGQGIGTSQDALTKDPQCCISGNVAPNLNNTTRYTSSTSTYTIPCGSTTANLSALTASNTPSGTVITWHSDATPTASNRINSANALAGTAKYYAAFYYATANCYSPTKMVTVTAPVCATDDDYSATPVVAGVGGVVGNIFTNDTYNGTIISTMPANSVDWLPELWTSANATVDGNGNLTISPSAPAGTYTYYYKICDKDPDVTAGQSCSIAAVTFKVEAIFGCNNNMYLSQINSGTTTLYTIGTSTNPFTYPAVGTASVAHNAMGLNPLDGKIYAMQQASNSLLVINTNGSSTNLGTVAGLPSATYFGGEIDNLGNYYVIANVTGGISTIYKINLTTKVATAIALKYANNATATLYLPDLSYSITTGLLYGVHSTTGQLVSITSTGTVTNVGTPYSPGENFGAMYTSSTGEVFGVRNDGGFYQFNLATGQRVLISGANPSSGNDGAHCVTMPIAFSADLQVTKTDNTMTYIPGTTTTYTVTVTNNGPYGVLNAVVSDPLPAGIPAANVSYTAVASTGSTTTVSGTQTGAINDLIGLPVGGTVTYMVTVNIPMNFTGNLVNIVTVTPPANITDSNMANNTATDTNTQGACFKPGITTGTVLNTTHGITALKRAGSTASGNNWPMVRKGAWTALEAKTKGFVINRLTTAEIANIPVANLIEGMMVYNKDLNCLQVNTTGTAAGWSCLTTPACPSN